MKTALIFSQGIMKIPHLAACFPEWRLHYAGMGKRPEADAVFGWGLRPTTQKARAYAAQKNLPYIALEDGFLRSLGLGVKGYPPYAFVFDPIGIYYHTAEPSALESHILALETLDSTQQAEAEHALALIRAHQLSKYNHALACHEAVEGREIVLVVDQTFGDMAVKYGQADASHFAQMLAAAIDENPHADIWVKTHPDVLSGKKRGYLTALAQTASQQARVRLFSADVNPLSLLEKVAKVYCVTSQMGFEALMLGKTVVTFGVPWFAGWGLTDDRHPQAQALATSSRRAPRALLNLFYAAYFAYSRYLNPINGEAGTIFDVIDYLREAKQRNQQLAGHFYCVGMSWWKQAVIRPFFALPQCQLHFVRSLKQLEKRALAENARLLVWGNGKPEQLAWAAAKGLPVWRMEDGFIRSVGLGSNLVSPLSLVVDDLGIYFNPQTPSRLEQILNTQRCNEAVLAEARQLQAQLIETNIGKYNVGVGGMTLPNDGRKRILVTGQVEDDASIRLGSPAITKNADLLRQVKTLNPEAYIIYKPHPDVVSGNRVGDVPEDEALRWVDQVVVHANVLDCIAQVDEVHTMTSLAGFEALLRGKVVHCYGLPFYAGWGLTTDHLTISRRTRRLRLEELIAGVLIHYPFYLHPKTQVFCSPREAISQLAAQRRQLTHGGFHRSWLAKQAGKVRQLYRVLKQKKYE